MFILLPCYLQNLSFQFVQLIEINSKSASQVWCMEYTWFINIHVWLSPFWGGNKTHSIKCAMLLCFVLDLKSKYGLSYLISCISSKKWDDAIWQVLLRLACSREGPEQCTNHQSCLYLAFLQRFWNMPRSTPIYVSKDEVYFKKMSLSCYGKTFAGNTATYELSSGDWPRENLQCKISSPSAQASHLERKKLTW